MTHVSGEHRCSLFRPPPYTVAVCERPPSLSVSAFVGIFANIDKVLDHAREEYLFMSVLWLTQPLLN
jgi:hypothetical protein